MHFLRTVWVLQPFLQFGFTSNPETAFQPQPHRGSGEVRLRTHRNKVDHHHQRANGNLAQRALPIGRPREGHSHSGIQVRKIHLGSHRR